MAPPICSKTNDCLEKWSRRHLCHGTISDIKRRERRALRRRNKQLCVEDIDDVELDLTDVEIIGPTYFTDDGENLVELRPRKSFVSFDDWQMSQIAA